MMRVYVWRDFHGPARPTLSKMYIDGKLLFEGLEDEYRGDNMPANKVPGRTCIACGTYDLLFTYSDRFQAMLPLVANVAGFRGIRHHAGNTEVDTEGCLLVGLKRGTLNGRPAVLESRAALARYLVLVRAVMKPGTDLIGTVTYSLSPP